EPEGQAGGGQDGHPPSASVPSRPGRRLFVAHLYSLPRSAFTMALAVSVKHETSAPDRRRFHVALAASAALGATVALLLTQMTPIKAFEAFAADVRISLFGGVMPERHDIAIIAVDEAALRRFPFRSPVNRAFLARLVEAIDRRGARVIGVDLLLDRPTIPEDDAALA